MHLRRSRTRMRLHGRRHTDTAHANRQERLLRAFWLRSRSCGAPGASEKTIDDGVYEPLMPHAFDAFCQCHFADSETPDSTGARGAGRTNATASKSSCSSDGAC